MGGEALQRRDAGTEEVTARDPDPEYREVECFDCGGDGEYEDPPHRDGRPGRGYRCDSCDGKGVILIEVHPITEEDLAEL